MISIRLYEGPRRISLIIEGKKIFGVESSFHPPLLINLAEAPA
jgi:hypothetical protein